MIVLMTLFCIPGFIEATFRSSGEFIVVARKVKSGGVNFFMF